jgi:GNAT superfamily N-acetyltransferase
MPLLRQMILEFAEFEKLAVSITEERLVRDGFGERPRFRALILEWEGKPAGHALYFPFYSSFEGEGIFLEDLYVREAFRGKGIGKAVMAEMARIAVREGVWALCWEVLDWNEPAIDFYRHLGASFMEDRKAVRLDGDALQKMAESGLPSR